MAMKIWNKKKKVVSTYDQPLTMADAILKASKLRSDKATGKKPRRVAINLAQLRQRCLADIPEYFNEGVVNHTKDGAYIYKDNGADILAVAHLDTVAQMKHFHRISLGEEPVVFNAQLDDRLGAYILLDLLPSYGLKYDILLTEGEESGRSTGQWFVPPEGKEYKWMFQFDRSGTDVVMYQYENRDMRDLLIDHGFVAGIGSFSDISMMDELGCKGFNFGCGYYDNHTRLGHMLIRETCTMVARFIDFFYDIEDVHLHHEYDDMDRYYSSYGAYEYGYGRGAYQKDSAWEYDEDKFMDSKSWDDDTHEVRGWEHDCPFCYRPVSECDKDLCREARHNVMAFGAREWRDKCDYCDADVSSEEEYWMTKEGDLLCYECADALTEELGDTFQLVGFNLVRYEALDGGG